MGSSSDLQVPTLYHVMFSLSLLLVVDDDDGYW